MYFRTTGQKDKSSRPLCGALGVFRVNPIHHREKEQCMLVFVLYIVQSPLKSTDFQYGGV